MITDLFGFDLQNEAPSSVQAKVGGIGESVAETDSTDPSPSDDLFGFDLQNQVPSSVQAKVGGIGEA